MENRKAEKEITELEAAYKAVKKESFQQRPFDTDYIQANLKRFWALRKELEAGGMSKQAANRSAYNQIIRVAK